MGNEARFINDYRGVTDKPNAIFQEYRSHSGELCMAVWSSARVIKKGDEILVSYGKSWWQTREDELAKPEKTVECTSTEQMSE
jgi:SET domain-containing protein